MTLRRCALAVLVAALLLGGLLPRAPAARAIGAWTPVAPPDAPPGAGVGSATLLQDGRVLVTTVRTVSSAGPAGGWAQIYDPVADRWSPAAPFAPNAGRATPTLLPDGRILFVAGTGVTDCINPGCRSILKTAQVYDAAADIWTPVAPLRIARSGHTTTLLPDGTILVVGGDTGGGSAPAFPTATVERYDPRTNQWSEAAPLTINRAFHTATLLPDGRVLVTGGLSRDASYATSPTATAELYDSTGNRWTPVASLLAPLDGQTATLLRDGRVLVMGRQRSNDPNDVFRAAGQIYDPAADRWTPTPPLVEDRFGYTVTLLPDGRVLVVGNADSTSNGLASTELYDPDRNVWASNTPTTVPRYLHASTALQDGRVLVLGGSGTTTAEVFNPTPAPQACFAETGHCMRGPFLAYWQAHGGLARNGYPLSDERIEVLEDGRAYQVQYFERVRLEYHPENDPPYDVLLGQFGRRTRPADPPAAPHPDQVYFAETGHNLGDGFLDYWRANGDLAQFGFPISEVIEQELDGTVYRVQYFERSRFEYHPDNAAPYNILLGQFGRQILAEVDAGR